MFTQSEMELVGYTRIFTYNNNYIFDVILYTILIKHDDSLYAK